MTMFSETGRGWFSCARVFVFLVGLALVLSACFADSLDLGGKVSTGGFGKTQLMALLAGMAMVLAALAMPRAWAGIVAVNLAVFLITLLVADNILYLGAARWPDTLAIGLSEEALVRRNTQKAMSSVQGDYYHFTDQYFFYVGRADHGRFDEFGYRNPPGYISAQKGIDTILLGDSFIEGEGAVRTVADDLRGLLPGQTVYSLGIAGQGPPHWGLQFERYARSTYFRAPPRVIVMNFYGGNDARDTHVFMRGRKSFHKFHFSFFREATALIQYYAPFTRRNFQHERFSVPSPLPGTSTHVHDTRESTVFFPEEELDRNDHVLYQSIASVIAALRRYAPRARLVLSYIPATQACYADPGQGERNAAVLEGWSRQWGIVFVNSIKVLREQAGKEIIHVADGHFNDKGYALYARILMPALTGKTIKEGP